MQVFPLFAVQWVTISQKLNTVAVCVCVVYRSLNRCHDNVETPHPLKGQGPLFGNNRGLTASRQITEPAVRFL